MLLIFLIATCVVQISLWLTCRARYSNTKDLQRLHILREYSLQSLVLRKMKSFCWSHVQVMQLSNITRYVLWVRLQVLRLKLIRI
jgi:hypothetical protein